MSTESLAAFRKNAGKDMAELAKKHMEHDLQPQDRDTLNKAATALRNHATIGSLVGLGIGLFMAFRIRSSRTAMFNAFKARERPTHVQFSDGRTEAIPNITPYLKPTFFGDLVTYFFFSTGGLFVGGETGLLTGSATAGRAITRDPESRQRIETAFKRFRAEVLRKEADKLEGKDDRGVWGNTF